ncbi:BolA/IbaG family iron-sulfur metabolism protein [Sphingomicrobium astaxanthinifaciens]|uniref:BolA/IbaG family iron-sulfur metabolism protein n=1 Tax=Sphingomicrobium astaxanthinifaciens TaxID=1227949 RepID=UPI001FCBE10B|nr:BolA/IbaG family iron-sulfur metabolism protein [Sphingomicrobium astaxanthinifaciens]MCJ7421821.1 BolA/IbaG family iron-sulfur metabolism protein [Sphingomicrobium astaxanthinifaciens]
MPMTAAAIEAAIKAAIPDAEVELTDLAGDDDHWAAVVTSAEFAGLSRVRQHQKVYAALGGRMGGELHALQLTTRSPAQETRS